MTKKFEEEWNEMSIEEKNVIVSAYLKTLSKWNFKRVLCDALDVDNYMDDEGLAREFYKILNER